MNFDQAVRIVLKHEGGYSNDSLDPGGETKFGISKRQYPNLNVRDLSEAQAREIYRMDYWDRLNIDQLPPKLRLIVFDCAVNQGQARAAMLLQRSLGIVADGIIGPKTIDTAYQMGQDHVVLSYAKLRHNAYASNPNWMRYGKGWSRRLLEVAVLSISSSTSEIFMGGTDSNSLS